MNFMRIVLLAVKYLFSFMVTSRFVYSFDLETLITNTYCWTIAVFLKMCVSKNKHAIVYYFLYLHVRLSNIRDFYFPCSGLLDGLIVASSMSSYIGLTDGLLLILCAWCQKRIRICCWCLVCLANYIQLIYDLNCLVYMLAISWHSLWCLC